MRAFSLSRCVSIIIAAALLAACGGAQPPLGAPGAMPQTARSSPVGDSVKYNVVYSFGEAPDGARPQGSLIAVGDKLYGTTAYGGAYVCFGGGYPKYGCGTVFSVTPSGTEKVLYSFGKSPDANIPLVGLIDVNSRLYGTTVDGGANYCRAAESNCGTVFSITRGGTETVLHSFRGKAHDGAGPAAPLLDVNGTLYGATQYGGKYCGAGGCGTIFSITTGGKERILHNFTGPPGDGAYPLGGLVDVNGKLYGTTSGGGKRRRSMNGTVFSITGGGTETVLHFFRGKAHDGAGPAAPLLDVNGTLYGTTEYGGKYAAGTVFSIRPLGKEKILHSFGNGTDGRDPIAGLVDVDGILYGTTSGGGTFSRGTIFTITTAGAEQVLHSFGKRKDGRYPKSAMYYKDGKLFGTTPFGGVYGNGTVFSFTP